MKCSFYRPHARVTEDGTVTDPITGEVTTSPSMTKQSFAAECDINNIIRQFSKTGQISHMSAKAALGMYQDLPDPLDFQEALHIVKASEEAFAQLPSGVRARFEHDPTQFLDFMSNPSNQEEIISMGLATDLRPPSPPLPTPSPEPTKPPTAT